MATQPGGYQVGQGSATGATDGSGFPVSGSGSSATQDSLYGISAKLAVIPVKISNASDQYDQASKVAYMGEGPAPQGPPPNSVMPWESALALLYTMNPSERGQIQQKLYDAGFYPKSYYGKTPDIIVPGEIDPGTETAWRNAIEETVRSSTYDQASKSFTNAKSLEDVLNERIAANDKVGGQGGTLGVRLTNPTDLRMVAKDTGQKFLGRNPDPHFVDNYVAAYHAAEVAAQNPDASGNVTAAPDPQAFAEQMMRQQYPVDIGVNDALNVGNQLVNALSRPAGSALPTSGQVNA